MDSEVLKTVTKIIERDNKTSTYKFALLRGTIEIILEDTPYKRIENGRAYFPMGLLIKKWIFYYYPLLSSSKAIPQTNSPKGLAFEIELLKIIDRYKNKGDGISVLYNDLLLRNLDGTLMADVIILYDKLRLTIANMPMKHLGFSIFKKHYSVFQYHSEKIRNKSERSLDFVTGYGFFSIPVDYYEAFRVLGSFLAGQDSILSQWASFSFSSSLNRTANKSEVIERLLLSPITERDVKESKIYYRSLLENSGRICCVWTGKQLQKFDIDHAIPFSIWKNNDLWNLLPSSGTINNNKRDKIPSPKIIEAASERIFYNWNIVFKNNENRFRREIENSLLGQRLESGWQKKALRRLQENADYLIKTRGYEEWKL